MVKKTIISFLLLLFIISGISSARVYAQTQQDSFQTLNFSGFYSNPAMNIYDDALFSILYSSNFLYLNTSSSQWNYNFENNELTYSHLLCFKPFFQTYSIGLRFNSLFYWNNSASFATDQLTVDLGLFGRSFGFFQWGFTVYNLFEKRNYEIFLGVRIWKTLTVSALFSVDEENLTDFDQFNTALFLDFQIKNNLYLSFSINDNIQFRFSLNKFFDAPSFSFVSYFFSFNGTLENEVISTNGYSSGFSVKSGEREPVFEKNNVYEIDLVNQGVSPQLLLFLKQLAAKKDQKIVVLKLGNGIQSLTEVEDLVPLLDLIKSKGNKIITYLYSPHLINLALASVSDSIMMNPSQILDIKGLAISNLYLKDFFEKYGIQAVVIKTGNYKSAYENYSESEMTEENRSQYELYLQRIFDYIAGLLTKYRGISKDDFFALVNEKAFVNADDALKYKLVDKLIYEFDFEKTVLKFGTEFFKGIPKWIEPSLETPFSEQWNQKKGIGIVHLIGPIMDVYQPGPFSGQSYAITTGKTIEILEMLQNNQNIKGVLLVIDSPGGSAVASDTIYMKIKQLAAQKPVWVLQEQYTASGGYYISCGGEKIISHQTTLTGSIGVISVKLSIEDLLKKYGITYDTVKIGQYADIFSLYSNLSEDEIKILEENIKWFLEKFESIVAKERKLTLGTVKKLGGGRIWSGIDAANNRLVDSVSHFTAVLDLFQDYLSISNDEIVFFHFYPSRYTSSLTDVFGFLNLVISMGNFYQSLTNQPFIKNDSLVFYYF